MRKKLFKRWVGLGMMITGVFITTRLILAILFFGGKVSPELLGYGCSLIRISFILVLFGGALFIASDIKIGRKTPKSKRGEK